MKKLLYLFIVALIFVALPSCGGDEPDNPDGGGTENPNDTIPGGGQKPGGGGGDGGSTQPESIITDEEKSSAIRCSIPFQFDYYGDYYKNGGHNFLVALTTDGLAFAEDGATVVGSGYLITFDLNAAVQNNMYPTKGKYVIEVDSQEPGTALAGYRKNGYEDWGYEGTPEGYPEWWIERGSFAVSVENGERTEWLFATSGYIKFDGTPENAEIFMHYVYDDGSVNNFYYNGAVVIRDGSKKQ